MGCGDCLANTDGEDATDGAAPLSKSESRSCTDCLCAIIFLLFCVGMAIIAGFAAASGSVYRVVYGYDSFGNLCDMKNEEIPGVKNSGMDTTDRPYVFFMDVLNPDKSIEICVKQCPSGNIQTQQDVQQFARVNGSFLCTYDVSVEDYTTAAKNELGPCPLENSLKDSKPILNRCIPDNLGEDVIQSALDILNSSQFISEILADLYIARWAMLGMCGLAFVFAFLMVFLIRFVAKFIVWIIYIVAIGSCSAVTGLLWYTYKMKKDEMDTMGAVVPDSVESDVQAFLIYSIISTVFLVVLLLVILVMRKRVAFAVELLNQAGKALIAMPLLLIQPLWTFIALILFFAYWSVVMLLLSVTGDATLYNGTNSETYVEYNEPDSVGYFWWYHLFGLIWISEFILACQQFIIAACVADWYFTRDKGTFSSPILRSIGYLMRYHFGSVAFGAFIITLVKIPRAILLFLQSKMKGSANSVVIFMLKCLSCCLWCLEKFLKFLNANAYTVIAIEGKHFCFSAKRAFFILVSNALRVAAINCVGDFVLFLGKIGVAALTALCGLVILEGVEELNYYAVPLIAAALFAFLIACAFFSIYEMTIDSLLICFCEDTRVNDGSPEKPYFMETGLMEFVSNSTKAMEAETRKDKIDEADGAASPEEVQPALKSENLYPDLEKEEK